MTRRILAVFLAALALLSTTGAASAAPHSIATAVPAGPVAAGPTTDALCELVPEAAQKACKAVGTVVDPTTPGGVGAGLAELSSQALSKFTPEGMLEGWAKDVARDSAGMLASTQELLLTSTAPKLDAPWFVERYAITFGLGLVVMAFALVAVVTRLGASGDVNRRPEAQVVLQEAGVRAAFFVPMVVALPTAVYLLSQISYGLAAGFGEEAQADASSAVEWYVSTLAQVADMRTFIAGGALSMFGFTAVTWAAAFVALVELTIAQYGLYLAVLVMPLALALAINPQWRRGASIAMGVLIGILMTPAVVFFGYWVLWGLVKNSTVDITPAGIFRGFLLIAAGTSVVVSLPVLLGFLMPQISPTGAGTGALSSVGASATGGASQVAKRAARQMSRAASSSGRGAPAPRTGTGPAQRTPSNARPPAAPPGPQGTAPTRRGSGAAPAVARVAAVGGPKAAAAGAVLAGAAGAVSPPAPPLRAPEPRPATPAAPGRGSAPRPATPSTGSAPRPPAPTQPRKEGSK